MVASITPVKFKPVARQARSPRQLWWNFAAVVACQLLALLCVEGVLYGAGLGEEEIFHFDKEIGFVHIHNKRVTWRTEGFATSYLNADGMRETDLTVTKPANTYRVALLGDSVVEGLQVPIEKTFGQIIGRRLSPLAGKQVQFLNFAVSGYSTVQELLQLKRQVLQYQPDIVIVCYNSRDLFENWSPPDQVITNVRPYALALPGRKLFVATLPVRRWMRSPRGQFMLATAWLREHSRIAGMLSALDLEWSQHNPWYRALIDVFSHPQKAAGELAEAIAGLQKSGPSFQIKFFEDSPKPVQSQQQPAQAQPAPEPLASASSNSALRENPVIKASAPESNDKKAAAKGESTYKQLVKHTFVALLQDMQAALKGSGAELAVLALPARAQLCPLPNMDTAFDGIDYNDELKLVQESCIQVDAPYLDVEQAAARIPESEREKLFYAVHLSPEGQKFIADDAQPFVRKLLNACSRGILPGYSHSGYSFTGDSDGPPQL